MPNMYNIELVVIILIANYSSHEIIACIATDHDGVTLATSF